MPFGVNRSTREEPIADLESAADGELLTLLNQYLQFCHNSNEEKAKKDGVPFPNLAGFCRWIGCSSAELTHLQAERPTLYDRICTVLEDEALNSQLSASVLTAYLKQRLWKGDAPPEKTSVEGGEQLRLVFEHNILEDGS